MVMASIPSIYGEISKSKEKKVRNFKQIEKRKGLDIIVVTGSKAEINTYNTNMQIQNMCLREDN